MGIFDKLKSSAIDTVMSAAGSIGNRAETFTFAALPESLAELRALPEAALDSPFQTAALTVLALCAYAADRNIGQEMLNWLRGPRPLNGQDISFLNDRFRETERLTCPSPTLRARLPKTTIRPPCPIPSGSRAAMSPEREPGYMKLFIPCGGADAPRPIDLRQRGSDGKWDPWEQYLLTGVRTPKAADPWA